MGQLIIKYKSKNPGIRELIKNIDLTYDEKISINGMAVSEIILDGQIYSHVNAPLKEMKRE